MSNHRHLTIDDLEPSDELTPEELDQISGGTLKPGVDGPTQANVKTGIILTPDDNGLIA
jgi:hypothetical protein